MTLSDALLLATFTASFCSLWLCVLWIVPARLTSLYRYRLWLLRDDVVDDVLSGRLSPSDTICDFVDAIENAVQQARSMTLLKWLLTPLPPPEYLASRMGAMERDMNRLDEEAKARFKRHLGRFQDVVMWYLLSTSLVGWLLIVGITAINGVRALVSVLKSRASGSVARDIYVVAKSLSDSFGENHIVSESALLTKPVVINRQRRRSGRLHRPVLACVE